MLPTFILATICAGGTTIVEISLVGSIPPAANQYRIHKSCVPPGNVIAAFTGLPLAFFFSRAALNGVASVPSFKSAYSLPTEIHWPPRFKRARIYMGVGRLFGVTTPAEIR